MNDMLIAVELNQRKAEATGREKDKKSQVEYHTRREATLPIVDRLKNKLENDVRRLKSKELEVLLWWKGVPMSVMGNVANRCILEVRRRWASSRLRGRKSMKRTSSH